MKTYKKRVREIIEEVVPNTIVLEICKERAQHLWSEITRYKNMVKNGHKITRYHKKQLLLGSDFRTALQEGSKIDAKFVFGDMDTRLLAEKYKFALKKSLKNPELSFNDRMKLRMRCFNWLDWIGLKWNRENTLNRLMTRKQMKQRQDFMNNKAPYLQKTILHQRNDMIAMAIRDCDGELVVAVVGMDHMEGIENRFRNKFVGIDENIHNTAREEMHKEQGMDRLSSLRLKDQWIGHEFDEFKYSRDLPQKMI